MSAEVKTEVIRLSRQLGAIGFTCNVSPFCWSGACACGVEDLTTRGIRECTDQRGEEATSSAVPRRRSSHRGPQGVAEGRRRDEEEEMGCPRGLHRGDLQRPLLPASIPRGPPPLPWKPSSVSFLPSGSATSTRPHLAIRASTSPATPSGDGAFGGALSSLLKPVFAALTIGAALFFARLCKPFPVLALASPVHPAVESDTLPYPSPAMDEEEAKERALEEYLDSYPEDTRALRALMQLKIKARKLAEAITLVDRLIPLEPREKGLLLLKAHLQSYGGDTETAKQVFEEMLQRDPLSVEAYHGLVMAAASQSGSEGDLGGILERIKGAMELCEKEKRKEELRDFKLLVAQVKVTQGDYGEALKVYQELVKEEPRDFRPYLCQGIIYTMLRKKEEADKQFQKYRRLVPRGHPFAQYFDENMVAMDVFSQMGGSKRELLP